MKIPLYQVDAFAEQLFRGNPAAVCLFESWPSGELMQMIAAENNLAETAFVVPAGEVMEIRWFTPVMEVDLCGHATLASAHVLFAHEGFPGDRISFLSLRSGPLAVGRKGEVLTLDFPADPVRECAVPDLLVRGFGRAKATCFKGRDDFMMVFGTQEEVEALQPDFRELRALESRGVIATAPGRTVDFVSRFFAPGAGIDEDPVTGSAHTTLAPYWSGVLGKTILSARQLSARGGSLLCEIRGERVLISGKAQTYLTGHLELPLSSDTP
ncbi:MAG: PhzF family phenazine biosynthesis protein [Bacteroidales bacterium]